MKPRAYQRFSVIIEDGADEQHVLLVRGRDLDDAVKRAVKKLRRDIGGPIDGSRLTDGINYVRKLKELTVQRIFAGHVRELGKIGEDVTHLR